MIKRIFPLYNVNAIGYLDFSISVIFCDSPDEIKDIKIKDIYKFIFKNKKSK